MTIFYNFALKIETIEVKRSLSSFWKLEMPMMLLRMFDLIRIILNAQNLQCKIKIIQTESKSKSTT